MNKIQIHFLKALRKIYVKSSLSEEDNKTDRIIDPNTVADIIYRKLSGDEPCMIARIGSNELNIVSNYIGWRYHKNEVINYIKGKVPPWWWEEDYIHLMHEGAGFFPPTEAKVVQFCELMINDIPQVDVLGSWLEKEKLFEKELNSAKKVRLVTLDPFWANEPWTKALHGKKVLVIHPFAETIEMQYTKRKLLFDNQDILPEFELKTIKAVQSIAGTKTPFSDWFEALEYMKSEIDKTDYDICLIGAGAYGFPLAAHVKRTGKKGFHIGGSLQLLFGIIGKRWEKNYHELYDYASLINEHWVRAKKEERPDNANKVEDGCYW
ncbi:MAG: hypothetical protein R2757_13845 [Draconibacterium sp.]